MANRQHAACARDKMNKDRSEQRAMSQIRSSHPAIRQITAPPTKPPKPAQYIEMARQSLDRQTAWS